MYETLFLKLASMESSYKKGLDIANNVFNSLEKSAIKALPALTIAQTNCMAEIRENKENLREEVKSISELHGIDSKDYKIKDILYLFNQIKKEKLLDSARRIYELEVELQKALYRNQDFLSQIIKETETIIESAIDYSESEYNESQLFLNEKF